MPDPFGLKAGSTPPAGMANYFVAFHAVPKPHPAFQSYSGSWTPEGGLVRVTASSQAFEDEADCRSARDLYDRLKRQLEQVYGASRTFESLDHDAVFREDDEFWTSLNNNERDHGCRWDLESSRLDSGIEMINLIVAAEDAYDSSKVLLSYQFRGFTSQAPSDEYGLESL